MKQVLFIGLSFLLAACPYHGDPPGDPPPIATGPVTFLISFSDGSGTSPREIQTTVNSIKIDVSRSDNTIEATQIFVRGTAWTTDNDLLSVTMNLPIEYKYNTPEKRGFILQAFAAPDGTGTPLFQGSTERLDVSPEIPPITITLFPPPNAVPTITSFIPVTGCGGAQIIITGTNFDPIITNNTVSLMGTDQPSDDRLAFIMSATPTELKVIVPRDAISGRINVSNLRGNITSPNDFTLAQTPCLGFPIRIPKDPDRIEDLQVALSGSTVIAAWIGYGRENSSYLTPYLFVARSIDGGATFEAPVKISKTNVYPWYEEQSRDLQLAFSGTTVIVAWRDAGSYYYSDENDIFIARSTDSGATFSSPVNLSNDRSYAYAHQFVFSGSTIMVAWLGLLPHSDSSVIFVARSTDSGATFTAPVNLPSRGDRPRDLTLALSGSTAILAWISPSPTDTDRTDIFVSRSTDNGETFSAPMNISNASGFLNNLQFAFLDATVIATWQDFGTEERKGRISMSRSIDGGVTFSAPVYLSDRNSDAYEQQVAVSGSTVIVTWIGSGPMAALPRRGPYDLFLTRSTDSGANFSSPVNISNDRGDPSYYQLALSHARVMVIGKNKLESDIFTFYSTDGGESLQRVYLSNNNRHVSYPRIAFSDSTGIAIWQETDINNSNGLWVSLFK